MQALLSFYFFSSVGQRFSNPQGTISDLLLHFPRDKLKIYHMPLLNQNQSQ